jgi:hypothetical protein
MPMILLALGLLAAIHRFSYLGAGGEGGIDVEHIQGLFDHVVQGCAIAGQQLDGVHVCLVQLRFHVGEVDGLARCIELGRRDQRAFAIMAQLAGDIDRILDLHGLNITEGFFPGDAQILAIFFY